MEFPLPTLTPPPVVNCLALILLPSHTTFKPAVRANLLSPPRPRVRHALFSRGFLLVHVWLVSLHDWAVTRNIHTL